MVNVRTNRLSNDPRRAVARRGVPSIVDVSACTKLNTDCFHFWGINVRKRSLDREQPPRSLGHGPVMARGAETDGMNAFNGGSQNSSSRAFRSELNDDTVGTAALQTGHMTSEVLASLPDEHRSRETVKKEIELVVSL